MEDEDEEGMADGSKHLGLDNKDIASKSIDLSTTPSKKSPVNRETEEETSDCIEIRDEELDDGNIAQTTTNSGRKFFFCVTSQLMVDLNVKSEYLFNILSVENIITLSMKYEIYVIQKCP